MARNRERTTLIAVVVAPPAGVAGANAVVLLWLSRPTRERTGVLVLGPNDSLTCRFAVACDNNASTVAHASMAALIATNGVLDTGTNPHVCVSLR